MADDREQSARALLHPDCAGQAGAESRARAMAAQLGGRELGSRFQGRRRMTDMLTGLARLRLAAAELARSVFFRGRADAEISEEMHFHLDMEASKVATTRGLGANEARRYAAAHFGGVERYKDEVREARGLSWVEDGWADARFAARSLRRRPGFTSVAVITLALGIGATTALFGVVKRVLLTPLPYDNPRSIAVVWSAWKGFDQTWLSYDEWEGWKARVPAFADIGLFSDGAATFDGDNPERVRVASIQANILPILGVRPMLGRNFSADEDRPGGR